jgi:hypothetical protein
MLLLLLKLALGAALTGFFFLAVVNWIRPDLFRFESVAVTNHPLIIHAVDARLTVLEQLEPSQLLALPKEQVEHAQFNGRPAFFSMTKTSIGDNDVQVVVTAAVRDAPRLFSRRVFVAARGFRGNVTQPRTPLPARELADLARDADTSLFYSR